MGTQVTLKYDVTPIGTTSAKLGPLISGVPLPKAILDAMGLRIISDSTALGPPIVRTIVLGFDPSATAIASLALDEGGSITSVIVDPANKGLDYILPPLCSVVYPTSAPLPPPPGNAAQLRAFMSTFGVHIDAGGTGYVAPVVKFIGGLPPARALGALSLVPNNVGRPQPAPRVGCVRHLHVKDPGLHYPITTVCEIKGGGPQSSSPAIQATATPVIDAFGRITDLILTDMGAGYVQTPQVVLRTPATFVPPPGFRSCKAFAGMAEGTPAQPGVVTIGAGPGFPITAIAIASPGDGYITVPDIVITDSAGTGARATAQMGVGRIDAINRSKGIPATATVSITPAFQRYFPSTVGGNDPNQRRPFFRFLEAALSQAGFTPVFSEDPVVA